MILGLGDIGTIDVYALSTILAFGVVTANEIAVSSPFL